VIEVEVSCELPGVDRAPLVQRLRSVLAREGIADASVGLMVVDADQMAGINREHRDRPTPTDVLSFPIDGVDAEQVSGGPAPELGDIVICPDAANDPLTTLVVHGALHLLGYDHEVDGGEMLARQAELIEELN